MQPDLFTDSRARVQIGPQAVLLGGFAASLSGALLEAVAAVERCAPFRRMPTRGGGQMSVAMTNCGALGWVSDAGGYRYAPRDPLTDRAWPSLPGVFSALAGRAAAAAGFEEFRPDVCLINRYEPGARLSLHQDRDEKELDAPIVSVSLGVSATFLWGGACRRDGVKRYLLHHGDVAVWGGASRLVYHGVAPLPAGQHPETGPLRYNLTFRRAEAFS